MERISPLFDASPNHLARRVGAAARARRLALGWTRERLAERAGVSVDAIKRLEGAGRVGFDKLVRVAVALDATAPLLGLFPLPTVATLDDLEQQVARRGRTYGRRRDAGRPRAPRAAGPVTDGASSDEEP